MSQLMTKLIYYSLAVMFMKMVCRSGRYSGLDYTCYFRHVTSRPLWRAPVLSFGVLGNLCVLQPCL